MEHHDIDIYPIPSKQAPRFINEPWLVDESLEDYFMQKEPENQPDNIRIYVPVDLNREAILRRLNWIIYRNGGASERNEMEYSLEVSRLILQIEIYDQIWRVCHYSTDRKHSVEAVELVQAFVERLKEIPDECAELFPFETIEELEKEYLEKVDLAYYKN